MQPIDSQQAIKAVDELMLLKAGRRLSQDEKLVMEAAWEDKHYKEIAQTHSSTIDRLQRDVGQKLWILLTGILGNGEKVTKKRLRSILEQRMVAGSLLSSAPSQSNPVNTSAIPVIGGQPPNVQTFFGREAELIGLKEAIVNCRCLVIYGAPGFGKSALATKLIEEISTKRQPQFERLIWQSVHYGPTLKDLLVNLLKDLALPSMQEQQLPQSTQELATLLIKTLSMRRCLIVLDSAEAWLRKDRNSSFNLYGEQYSEYGVFFRRIIEVKHSSCIILTCREPFKDLMKLQRSGRPSDSFKLEGLDVKAAKEILQARELIDEQKWSELLEPYLGNPAAIELVASRIEKFFSGSVAKFLHYKTDLISEIFRETLAHQYQPERLSILEQQILCYLAQRADDANDFVSFIQIIEDLYVRLPSSLSVSELMSSIENLNNLSLIIISKTGETKELFLKLPPLLKKYIFQEKQVKLLRTAHAFSASNMRIIARNTLRRFWEEHPDVEEPLKFWYAEVSQADWSSPADIKALYRNVSIVANNRAIFNIKGNSYRFIVAVRYDIGIGFIRFIGTHAQYDKVDAKTI
ncbi:type II toxin-antitoxin system HigB family toxin [Chroococcidiopsis sp. FACHB-1243]|uniref:type II toxin-antitoxin system HigB family toxin n=1 Tax=Chroococcidiopsis sp. [FACHB-1243] TaxID=2692781 RepID=UPI00177DA912|nr:type II toxin-antitoxin system HigB family toxin [Chroococcidiopsis sp. [FACHB-1243]]MBD2309888.1 type II toxin-antitoxin system HigB family toxin [Chroococcidiopsis sp. [FACHB-1243]]